MHDTLLRQYARCIMVVIVFPVVSMIGLIGCGSDSFADDRYEAQVDARAQIQENESNNSPKEAISLGISESHTLKFLVPADMKHEFVEASPYPLFHLRGKEEMMGELIISIFLSEDVQQAVASGELTTDGFLETFFGSRFSLLAKNTYSTTVFENDTFSGHESNALYIIGSRDYPYMSSAVLIPHNESFIMQTTILSSEDENSLEHQYLVDIVKDAEIVQN